MARYVTGTIAQLSGKISLNGYFLGQPELSVLSRIMEGTMFHRVGIVKRDGYRGRPAIVWQVDTETSAFAVLELKNGGLVTSNKPSNKLKRPKAA